MNVSQKSSRGISAATRIAVVLDDMDGEYHAPLLKGVCHAAQDLGIELVFLPGRAPATPHVFEQQFGVLFCIAKEYSSDGLLIFGTLLQAYLGEEGLRDFTSSFKRPAVVIGVDGTGHPSVLLDNRQGFKALVDHLIQVHGHRRIAVIEGPSLNRDAQERLAGYSDALRQAGIEDDPNLHAQGLFHQASGSAAMMELLQRGVPFSAVVCANDESAHGALSAAIECGLRVPEDVAITGFDDLLSIYRVGPSLTTIKQDIEALGATALRLLASKLAGEHVDSTTIIPTHPVFRRSCGCMGFSNVLPAHDSPLEAKARELVAQLDAPVDLVNALVNEVAALFIALTADDERVSFDQILTRMAFAWLRHQSDIGPLQNLLLSIHRAFANQCHCPEKAAERLQIGQIVLANLLELFHTRARVSQNNNSWALRQELKSQVTTVELDELLDVLTGSLRRLELQTCIIVLYDDTTTLEHIDEHGLPVTSRPIFALDREQTRADVLGVPFATRDLVPTYLQGSTAPRHWVVLPLFHMREHFGYMLLERQSVERVYYNDLLHEITGAVHSCLVVKELATARDALRHDLDRAKRDNETLSYMAMRDELTGLFNRRGFFELARSMMTTARLTGQPLTLFFADLDGLKRINDEYGHEEGDFAICAAANALLATFRQEDVVSRLGGDEFVVLTRTDNLNQLQEIESRLDQQFMNFDTASCKPYRLRCSLGATLIRGDDREPLDQVLARADQLLYAAKRGRMSTRTDSVGNRR